ncbi:MAG: hypothetical protein ACU84H_10150 [Gammaproteobacteria bacterium]
MMSIGLKFAGFHSRADYLDELNKEADNDSIPEVNKRGETMKTQFTLPNGEPTDCEIEITTKHSASSYGRPVLVNENGDVIDPMSWAFHRIVSATSEEIERLKALGLHIHHI